MFWLLDARFVPLNGCFTALQHCKAMMRDVGCKRQFSYDLPFLVFIIVLRRFVLNGLVDVMNIAIVTRLY